MKTILLIFLISVSLAPETWLTDLEQAKVDAKQSGKMILLNFSGSDWCAPCIKQHRDIFQQESFSSYADQKLVLLRADFPRLKKNQLDAKLREHNERLADQYNPQGKFPLTLLLDADGKILYTWDGFAGGTVDDFIQEIDAHARTKN